MDQNRWKKNYCLRRSGKLYEKYRARLVPTPQLLSLDASRLARGAATWRRPEDPDAIHRRPIQTRFIRGAGADDTRERITCGSTARVDLQQQANPWRWWVPRFSGVFPLDQHLSLLSLCTDKCWARFLVIFLLILISPCVLCDLWYLLDSDSCNFPCENEQDPVILVQRKHRSAP